MATFIPVNGCIQRLDVPLTLTQLRRHIGGEIELVDLRTDDVLIVQRDSWSRLPVNFTASALAGLKQPVCGPAVICSQDDLA
jgi:hypothetical protein